jgi:hypothetical protein
MTHEIFDKQQPKSNGLIKKVINSILCTLYLACIAFSYVIFTTEVSLHYVVLLFVAFVILMLSIIQIMLHRDNKKIWVGIITIGSTLGLLFAAFNSAPNESLMITGQLITGISFIISLTLYILIWKK